MIQNVIMVTLPSDILISNNALVVIGKETRSTVLDDFMVSLMPENPPLKLPWQLLEACFGHQESAWIWAVRLGSNIQLLPNIVDHILGCRWEPVILGKVAAVTTQRCLGTSCAVGLLATINDAKWGWVV